MKKADVMIGTTAAIRRVFFRARLCAVAWG